MAGEVFVFTLGAGPLYGGRHVFYSNPNWLNYTLFYVLSQLKATTASL